MISISSAYSGDTSYLMKPKRAGGRVHAMNSADMGKTITTAGMPGLWVPLAWNCYLAVEVKRERIIHGSMTYGQGALRTSFWTKYEDHDDPTLGCRGRNVQCRSFDTYATKHGRKS